MSIFTEVCEQSSVTSGGFSQSYVPETATGFRNTVGTTQILPAGLRYLTKFWISKEASLGEANIIDVSGKILFTLDGAGPSEAELPMTTTSSISLHTIGTSANSVLGAVVYTTPISGHSTSSQTIASATYNCYRPLDVYMSYGIEALFFLAVLYGIIKLFKR